MLPERFPRRHRMPSSSVPQDDQGVLNVEPRNIYAGTGGRLSEEEIVNLVATPNVAIERIVSTGQASPPGHWYDQERQEWVILL